MENGEDSKFIIFTNGSKLEIPEIVDMTVVRGGRTTEHKTWWELLLEEEEEDSQ